MFFPVQLLCILLDNGTCAENVNHSSSLVSLSRSNKWTLKQLSRILDVYSAHGLCPEPRNLHMYPRLARHRIPYDRCSTSCKCSDSSIVSVDHIFK